MKEFMPTLFFEVKTNIDGTATIALPVHAGTNYTWIPANNILGLQIKQLGVLDPAGPPGHTVYTVFQAEVVPEHLIGTGTIGLTEGGKGPIVQVAHLKVERLLLK
jgi:hypothetical protein